MISIRIQNVTKRFGAVVVLDALSLQIEPGELFFLLGPSGCGKTTLLRSLAGFHVPESGTICFDREDVTDLAPHKRNTGMMFQSYALWPHLTVNENVAFGLEERKLPRNEIKRRVAEVLESVHMGGYGERRPNELSGGQQQRVALARALVIRPRCLLLDEPLSNLDAKLRLEMRAEIRRVSKESRLTTVYVTHDQKEALSVADRMAILDHGKVLQVGTPADLYRRPATRQVATFIGETDILRGRLVGTDSGYAVVATDLGQFRGVLTGPTSPAPGGEVIVSIRPECWTLHRDEQSANSVHGRIGEAVYLGDQAQYDFQVNGHRLKVVELNPRFLDCAAGREVYASVAPHDVVVLVE